MDFQNVHKIGQSRREPLEQFRELAIEVCELLNNENVSFRPFRSKQVPWFANLPEQYKDFVLNKLKATLNIYRQTLASGDSLRESKTLLWKALKEYGLKGPSDLLEHIESNDQIVEIYDNSQIQVFCNLTFYDFCSYTLEELYCRPFPELFERENPEATAKILEIGMGMFQGKIKTTVDMKSAGSQKVKEIDSAFRFQYDMTIQSFIPLFRSSSQVPEALVAIETAKILDKKVVRNFPRPPGPSNHPTF